MYHLFYSFTISVLVTMTEKESIDWGLPNWVVTETQGPRTREETHIGILQSWEVSGVTLTS